MIQNSHPYLPPNPETEFIDTFVFDGRELRLKEFHIERTFETFQFLKCAFTINEIREVYDRLESVYGGEEAAGRIFRLLISKNNFKSISPESRKLEHQSEIQLTSVKGFIYSNMNPRFKWADRSHWRAYSHLVPHEWQDILAADQNGFASECSRFTLFALDQANSVVYTPPDDSGCLKGTLRESLIHHGSVVIPEGAICSLHTKALQLSDLKNYKLYVGNSVRGLLPARLV